jgi:hypothetical protein
VSRIAWTLLLLLAVVACGSPATAPQGTVIPSRESTGDCVGYTVVDPSNRPSLLPLTADPVLEAEFPADVEGQPVTNLESARWIETLCALGSDASVAAARRNLPPGMDVADIRVASGQVTVNGDAIGLTAFRLPGHGGQELLSVAGVMSSSVSPDAPRFLDRLQPATIAGKNVLGWTDAASGAPFFLYAAPDALFILEGASLSQADKILAVLP